MRCRSGRFPKSVRFDSVPCPRPNSSLLYLAQVSPARLTVCALASNPIALATNHGSTFRYCIQESTCACTDYQRACKPALVGGQRLRLTGAETMLGASRRDEGLEGLVGTREMAQPCVLS